MSEQGVHFEELQLHRVLGIGHGEGFALPDLCPGINLIHGPNGSGKSTTARTIQELLWPCRTGLERPTAAGKFREGESAWSITIDAGHAEASRNGRLEALPEFGPPENRRRYHLALHELIGDENADFAKAIADASQGGYDLEAAASTLGFTERPSSPRRLAQQLNNAQETVRTARRRQRDIEDAARQLDDLRRQRDEAVAAQGNVDLLGKARDCHGAEERCRRLKTALDAFPPEMARLHGNEKDELERLATEHEQLRERLVAERERIGRAEQELEDLRLPEQGVGTDHLAHLRAAQRRLSEFEAELRQHRQRLSEAEAEALKARDRLGERFTDEQLASLETVEIGQLSGFGRKVLDLLAQDRVVAERLRRLEGEAPDAVAELDSGQLRDGLTALGQWLASPTPFGAAPSRPRWVLSTAVGLVALLSIVLAVVHHWAWAAFAVAGPAAVMTWDWWTRRMESWKTPADPRSVHRDSYETTRLQPPEAWEPVAVAERVHRLANLAALRAREEDRLRQLHELQAERDAVEEKRTALERERKELQAQFGLKIDINGEWLPLLIDAIGTWQARSGEAAGAQAALARLEQERAAVLREINSGLGTFGYDAVDSAEVAARLIEDLDDRRIRHSSAVRERSEANRRIAETIDPRIEEITALRNAVFERLGVDESQAQRIEEWLAERPRYLQLRQQLTEAEAIREDRRAALADHEHLLKLDAVEIEQEIAREESVAARRDELSEGIAKIERDIEAAKAGHELSVALEGRDDAEAALADARDRSAAAVTGALLARWVRDVAVERSRPQVFRRANELLARFTRGSLQLELDDRASPPAFLARHGSGVARSVDRLSMGERVQLLMAVRIAFLEQDEHTRLPLLLDEALGNSDDGRAGVIIDTVIEVARQGRQIFYFTAQRDEVGKWVTRLKDAGMDHKVIDLTQVRRLSVANDAPLEIAAIEVSPPPAPEGMNHERYGRVLGVSTINPQVEHIDGLHLWHIVEDVELLHQLLCCQIATWSQLRTLLDHGGAGIIDANDRQRKRILATARAVEAACRAWRIGRGKSVDRSALVDAGCVSDAFIDELTALAKASNGDAENLLSSLEAGDVKYWRAENTERLREYFVEQGFLSNETPQSIDEIRACTLTAIAEALRTGDIDEAVIQRIIISLPQ